MSEYIPIVGAIALPNIGGIIGAIYTRNQVRGKDDKPSWYDTLKKPVWRPPNWVFGPMWTGLYCSMGYASYIVGCDTDFPSSLSMPLALYGTQLALNWVWPPLFFKMHKLDWALYEIGLLTATSIATAVAFYRVNPTAGYLFVPYVAWLGLASALNYTIWRDNPKVTGAKVTEIKEKK